MGAIHQRDILNAADGFFRHFRYHGITHKRVTIGKLIGGNIKLSIDIVIISDLTCTA